MEKKIYLLSENDADVPFVEELAARCELSLQRITQVTEAAQAFETETVGALFVDSFHCKNLEKTIQDTIGLFSERINPNLVHFISSEDLQEAVPVLQSALFGSYLGRNYGDPKEAAHRYSYLLKAALQPPAFDIKKLMSAQAKIQTIKFEKTSQKQDGVEAVKNFLVAVKFKSRMAAVIANAVDELVMNAMFDAPADEFGAPLYATTPRDTVMELQGRRAVEVHVGFDGHYVAITAVDQFGSVDKRKLVAHMSKRYNEEEYKIKKTSAGAGIGLATVFRSGGSFFFCCEQGTRTEVTVFFRRTDNFREFKDQFRFIATQFYY